MTELKKLKKQNQELISALKDANYFLEKHVDGYNLENPKYWNITEVLKKNGVKANSLLDNLT